MYSRPSRSRSDCTTAGASGGQCGIGLERATGIWYRSTVLSAARGGCADRRARVARWASTVGPGTLERDRVRGLVRGPQTYAHARHGPRDTFLAFAALAWYSGTRCARAPQ